MSKEAALAYERAVVKHKLDHSRLHFPNDYTSSDDPSDHPSDDDESDEEDAVEPPSPHAQPQFEREPIFPVDGSEIITVTDENGNISTVSVV